MQHRREQDAGNRAIEPVRTALIALGSNLGDREQSLFGAIRELATHPSLTLSAVSSVYETPPVGPPGQGAYLNACAELRTTLGAQEVLVELLEIERRFGRVRDTEQRWGPRILDLDLLLMGDLVIDEPGITVPHPRLHERLFVLAPLAEIAPDAAVPGLSARVGELLDRVRALDTSSASMITRHAPAPFRTPDMLGA